MSPNETFLIANGSVDELGDLQLGLNDNVNIIQITETRRDM